MAYGLPPTAPPWPSQQRCPPERHAAMARMQQRREQRGALGEEDFAMPYKGSMEDDFSRSARKPRARHTEVLQDAKRYTDEVESRSVRERPPKSADRRRLADEFDEEPSLRSSRRHREEPEEPPKRRDRERDRISDRDLDMERDRRFRDKDRDREMDRERQHEKSSIKKQQDDEEPLPPEVAKADFSTLQEMIAKQIKEAELQTELPELKPCNNDDQELRIRQERRKKREEEEQRRIEERKRQRKEREEVRLREMQEAQRREEEEEERKQEEERQKKADEELRLRQIKAATKIQAVHRGNCSRTGNQFAPKPVEGQVRNKESTVSKKTSEEGDLLM